MHRAEAVSSMTVVALLSALLVPQAAAPPEVLAQIQVRGNVATSDVEVRRLAGLEIGMPVAPDVVATRDGAAARDEALRSRRGAEALRVAQRSHPDRHRRRSWTKARCRSSGPAIPITRRASSGAGGRTCCSVPILGIESGYGVTYGARLTHPEPAGRDSRLSFPVTWGAQKRIGAEFEKRFADGWLTRVEAGGAVSRRTNPLFDADDDRAAVWFRAERQFTPSLRVRALTGWQGVSFQDGARPVDQRRSRGRARHAARSLSGAQRRVSAGDEKPARLSTSGTASTGPSSKATDTSGSSARRFWSRAREWTARTDALPDYLKPLFGGPSSVRGFKTGAAAGDSLVAGSLELRVPLTSPLSFGKIGVSAFVDAGTVYNDGQRLADQPWRRGVGGSVWFTAAFVRFNVAVAHGIGASTRVHVEGNLHVLN